MKTKEPFEDRQKRLDEVMQKFVVNHQKVIDTPAHNDDRQTKDQNGKGSDLSRRGVAVVIWFGVLIVGLRH